MQKYQRSAFSSIHSEGALLPLDILQRIAQFDTSLGGLTAEAYHHEGEKLNEVINEAWTHVLRAWHNFQTARAGLSSSEVGTALTREHWLLPLFAALDYGRLYTIKPFEVEGKTYAISHAWQHTPIHLVGCNVDLDHMARSSSTGLRSSPYSLVQEFLNRSSDHLWGMVSNGLQLRLLRKNVSITRQAFVEFDLETIFQGENYADFVLLWLLCHQSRVEAERPADCWLEKWSRIAQEQGIRALNKLRDGVEQAINILGSGFLAHSSNRALRERLHSGELNTQDYYHQVLRMVYRLIVLFVAEDREVLFHPQANETARQRYTAYYSTERLRRLAEQRIGTRHSDLFQGLWLVMEKLGSDTGCLELGLPSLNGFLFSHKAIPDLVGCELTNHDLLEAVRSLTFTLDGRMRRVVDYKNLGPEELGSVYESLLEMHPEINLEAHTFELTIARGNERKTSGSYYTPTSLIDSLLDSALDPVLEEARAKPNPEKAILNLKVCDPACGSGHFLIAAAHRIAKRLAAVRTGNEEPGPEDRRTALRDVVGHCIYGVDINPMAVELCKVNLWMEAIEPGKPLSFLDAHIQPGNSLLGATPALLAKGIPDSAFEAVEGDDKKVCSEYKKRNHQQREGNRTLFDPEGQLWPWDRLGDFAASMMQLDEISDDTVQDIHRKQEYYERFVTSSDYRFGHLWADAWCAAFVWKKNNEFAYPITEEIFRNIERNPLNIAPWMEEEIRRLAVQYQFFHWHLAFPSVFRVPTKDEESENDQAGWSGGFDVVLGNPPYIFGENLNRKLKMLFQTAFHLAKGQYDTYWLFIEQGSKLVNGQGRWGLVVPDTLLARDENQETRRFLLKEGLEYLYYWGTVFEASVSTIIFVASKGSKSDTVLCELLNGNAVQAQFRCSKERFLSDPKQRFLIHMSDKEANIFSRIENECEPLKNFVRISRGEEIGKKEVLSQGPIPIIVGEDISRYFVQQPSRFLYTIKKDAALYQSPKIVMLKTGLRCVAALDKVGYVTMQSVYNLHLTKPPIAYETLLALLNSRFVYCFVYKTFTSYKGLFPQLNQSTVEAIPVPRNIHEKQKDLISCVQNIMCLNEELKVAKNAQVENLIRSQIDIIDKEIDQSIYSQYGLNLEEINVIESNLKGIL